MKVGVRDDDAYMKCIHIGKSVNRMLGNFIAHVLLIVFALTHSLTVVADTSYLKGIDVSHYQGDVDWAAIKSYGVVFAYAKAAEGDVGSDSEFAENWAAMKSAGIIRSAYDFYRVGDGVDKQLKDYTAKVNLEQGDLPPMVDIETNNGSIETVQSLSGELHSYLEALESYYGMKPIIYTSNGFWNKHLDTSFSAYPLWIAEYGVQTPKIPSGWDSWTFWQYSQTGTVIGIDGSVDLDYFFGTLDELKKMTLISP